MEDVTKKTAICPQNKEIKQEEGNIIIDQLREKVAGLKFRLFDYQDQNQLLRKELLQARTLIEKEELEKPEEVSAAKCCPLTEQLKKAEQVKVLKKKVEELQNKIRDLESVDREENSRAQTKVQVVEPKTIKTSREKELFETCTKLKRKTECWKIRNQELKQERARLKLELERLEQKGKENQEVHGTYSSLEKQLQSVQNDKLHLRGKLDMATTKNQQMEEERDVLKDDIEKMRDKINDDDMLIEALTSQQKTFQDLISRQKLHDKQEHRNHLMSLNQILVRFQTNNDLVDSVREMMRQDSLLEANLIDNEPILMYARDEILESTDSKSVDNGSATTVASEDTSLPSEDSDQQPSLEQAETEIALAHLQSTVQQIDRLSHAVTSNNRKLNDWSGRLLQSFVTNGVEKAEIRKMEYTLERLEKGSRASKSHGTGNVDTMEKQNLTVIDDIFSEEFLYFKQLYDVSTEASTTFLKTYDNITDRMTKLYIDGLRELFMTDIVAT